MIPPNATELESAVLGAIMLERDAYLTASEYLRPEYFYDTRHGSIYRACERLFSKSEPIDILTVTNKLRESGEIDRIGGAHFVASLTINIGSAAHMVTHCQVIAEKYYRRRSIEIASEVINDATDESIDTFEVIETAENRFKAITDINTTTLKTVGDAAGQVLTDYIQKKDNPESFNGIKMELPGADDIVGYLSPGDLVIIGGRPSMGKTMTMLHIAKENAKKGNRGLVISLEMTTVKLTARMACSLAVVNSEDLKESKLSIDEENRFSAAIEKLKGMPLHIEDGMYDVARIRTLCRKFKSMYPDTKYILLDYLQKMRGSDPDNKGGNRDIQIGYFTGTCKMIAKELGLPFILLCQVGRGAEKNGATITDKIPSLSDLRESGNIEQDADIVIFPYRPAYYGFNHDEEGNDLSGDIWFSIGKNRDGSIGLGKAKCDLYTQRIFHEVPQGLKPVYDFTPNFDQFHEKPY
jgi:replicative DNA helicase